MTTVYVIGHFVTEMTFNSTLDVEEWCHNSFESSWLWREKTHE